MSSGTRAALATLVFVVATTAPVRSETLRASYDISLIGLPIGTGTINAEVSASSYAIDAQAKLNATSVGAKAAVGVRAMRKLWLAPRAMLAGVLAVPLSAFVVGSVVW